MGRVYTALTKSGQWSVAPGTVAHPVTKPEKSVSPAEASGRAASVSEFAPAARRRYPAPVLVPPVRKDAETNEPSRQAESQPEKYVETRHDPELPATEPVASNLLRLANLAHSEMKPEPQAAPEAAELHHRAEDGAEELILREYPVVRVGALNLDAHLAALGQPGTLSAERFQALAVRVFNLAQKRGIKSLLVTSALEAEGKTTVATGLAALMARPSDRRVLLVDSDLRRPAIARILGVTLGISQSWGWREVLEGKTSAFEPILRLEPMGLYFLPGSASASGPRTLLPPHNACELADQLGAGGMFASFRPEQVVRQLELQFDLVVIDSPAILESAESQRLASIADATLMVARAGKTHHSAVCDAVKLVPKDRRLGVVLNESS
ncbi:MAG TPA: CpsD/CapB family tyrosine-protein kinase [Blastocatellia bacterium]|nr:CpsD/CapB family tyrosine-protein kinase [Blastocatellia bacterium]